MDGIIFEVRRGLGLVTLDRPAAMNALTLTQLDGVLTILDAWREDPAVQVVGLRGTGETAFCAGLDLADLHRAALGDDDASLGRVLRTACRLLGVVRSYPKPVVAFVNGIAAGLGAGLAAGAAYQVATGHSLFGGSEISVGLAVGGGMSAELARLPGALGMWLALTGERVRAADMLTLGFATHYVPEKRLIEVEDALSLISVATEDRLPAVGMVLDAYHEEPGVAPVLRVQSRIDAAFGRGSVDDVLAALAQTEDAWAASPRMMLAERSPTALKVTFRQMQVAPLLDRARTIMVEYRLARRLLRMNDFAEAGRVALRAGSERPVWRPADLPAVEKAFVDRLFAPLKEEAEPGFALT